jgi:CHASE2 domain-containing sensor protein
MRRKGRIIQKWNFFGAVIFAALITAVVTWLDIDHYLLFLEAPDKFIYDWKVSLLSTKIDKQRNDLALVYIDDNSLADYPYRSPIDRGLLAELIRVVDRANPKAIGLDIIFDRPTEKDRDDALINSLNNVHTPVVLVATDEQERGIHKDIEFWQDRYLSRVKRSVVISSPFLGSEDTLFSLSDNVVRSMEPFDNTRNKKKPFAFALAKYERVIKYPSARTIDWLLPSTNGVEPFQTFVVQPHKRVSGTSNGDTVLPVVVRPFLQDKIVIIGANMIGLDRHRIPMTVATDLDVPGAYIQAQILAQIKDHREITDMPLYFSIIIIFITAFILFYAIEHSGRDHPEILFEFIIMALIISASILMFCKRINFPSLSLLMTWFLVAFFGKYAARIIKRLVKQRSGR